MQTRAGRPPAETLAWAQRCLGRGARILATRRLTGGLTARMHELTVQRSGRRSRVVLRHWLGDNEWRQWSVRAVVSEANTLTQLEKTDIPAPRVIASTTDQGIGPALLMTRVPGRMLLMPRDRERWVEQMAGMLARIHSLDLKVKPFESWLDASKLAMPADAERPAVWKEAFALVSESRVPTHTCFIHRDYQHFNLLWTRERLSGVVDWVESSVGPPDLDVGHCRLNLTLLFSAEVAERFREMYEAAAGRTVDPYWDVQSLLSYDAGWKDFLPLQIGNRARLPVKGMTQRMEQVIANALRRT